MSHGRKAYTTVIIRDSTHSGQIHEKVNIDVDRTKQVGSLI